MAFGGMDSLPTQRVAPQTHTATLQSKSNMMSSGWGYVICKNSHLEISSMQLRYVQLFSKIT